MPTIEERKGPRGKTWRVRVRLAGRHEVSRTFKSRSDAREWARRTEGDILAGRYFPGRRQTLADAIARYLVEVLPRKAPHTIRDQQRQLRHWREAIGDLRLADVSPAVVAEHRDTLGRRLGASSVNRHLNILSHVFSVASREWEWCGDNPVRRVARFKEPPGIVRFLDDDERARLLAACRESPTPCLYTIVLVALSTGMRKMEILTLRWPDVDVDRGLVMLQKTKTGERRGVPLRGPALEAVRELSKVRRIDTDLLFPGTRSPEVPIEIGKAWQVAIAKSGVMNFRFHDLRHSCASYLAMNGASLPEIAAVLGHRSLSMVARYAHIAESHVASVVEGMNRRMFGGDE
jgi:integrase